jgi:uncharacterized protein
MTLVAAVSLDVTVAGELMSLLAQRAAYWIERRTLIIADLHVGKSEIYRALGVPVPGGVMEESLGRLRLVMEVTGAERLVVLGDLVHGPRGLTDEVVHDFAAWRAGIDAEIVLVRGNHDRKVRTLPPSWRVQEAGDRVEEGPFVFVHEPCEQKKGFPWCGHLHPTVVLSDRNGFVRLPCFHVSKKRAMLPAFNVFTRGVCVEREPGDRVYAVGEGKVIEL